LEPTKSKITGKLFSVPYYLVYKAEISYEKHLWYL
jgi:hypothetical protein